MAASDPGPQARVYPAAPDGHASGPARDGSAREGLALDASLFEAVEQRHSGECLRLWESASLAAVVGRSGVVERDVYVDRCARDGVPVVRRTSGGGAVLVGPGCLNFSLVLSLERRPALRDVRQSYAFILGQIVEALGLAGLAVQGDSDLAWNGRKVSGNAQRRGLRALLHHGTLLYDFDASLMSRYLMSPPRQPPYRRMRGHAEFVANLPLPVETLRARLEDRWAALGDERAPR